MHDIEDRIGVCVCVCVCVCVNWDVRTRKVSLLTIPWLIHEQLKQTTKYLHKQTE
jgi:hypothetical protein